MLFKETTKTCLVERSTMTFRPSLSLVTKLSRCQATIIESCRGYTKRSEKLIRTWHIAYSQYSGSYKFNCKMLYDSKVGPRDRPNSTIKLLPQRFCRILLLHALFSYSAMALSKEGFFGKLLLRRQQGVSTFSYSSVGLYRCVHHLGNEERWVYSSYA